MTNDSQREEQIFSEAIEIADLGRRRRFLDDACGADGELRRRIERLIEAEEAGQNLFARADQAEEQGSSPHFTGEQAGDQIGRYKLLEQIGEGGFGLVYMAEQEEPVRRRVALKIIKLGMDTKQVVARFEAERQALALMDHPHIARVFDGGATETGRPYFVMDLVRGIPITEYCDKQKLTTRERLELFIPVCQAVQHAHQKGIIHRDLKPGNVMVTLSDGVPHPMVIDFGVAKAINQKLTEQTLFTNLGQMIGTPAYMAPEQAEMSRLDVDTRSDIYSLGVLLYELLTGTQPFPEEQLRSTSWAEMQRIIAEKEPPTPSRRLSKLTVEQQATLSRTHGEGPGRLRLLLCGDLDWIVMKCLEKDRDRRYETAKDLVADIRHTLCNEPISARPPSVFYEFSRLARRHRAAVASVTAVITALVIGLWVAIIGLKKAEREKAIATAVSEFLDDDLLAQADAWNENAFQSPRRDLLLLDVVNRASTNLNGRFPNQPVVEASIRLTLGKIFIGLSEWQTAKEHLERALELFEQNLGDDDNRTIETRFILGKLELAKENLDEADRLFNNVLRHRIRSGGERSPAALGVLVELAQSAETRGDYKESEKRFRHVIELSEAELGDDNSYAVNAKLGLADVLWAAGRRAEATQFDGEALIGSEGVLGSDHPLTIKALGRVAFDANEYENDFPKSAHLYEEALRRSQESVGDAFPSPWLMVCHSQLLRVQGLYLEDLDWKRRAYELSLRMAGPHHFNTLVCQIYIGFGEAGFGNYAKAISILEPFVTQLSEVAPTDFNVGIVLQWLDDLYWVEGDYERAVSTATRFKDVIVRSQRPDVPVYANAFSTRAGWLMRLGRWREAAGEYAAMAELPGKRHDAQSARAEALALSGASSEGKLLARQSLEKFTARSAAGELQHPLMIALILDATSPDKINRMLDEIDPALGTVHDQLSSGIADYRSGDRARAMRRLRPVQRDCPDPYLAAIAGGYLCLALHDSGRHEEALAMLNETRDDVNSLVCSGDLGPRFRETGYCLLALREAERKLAPDAITPLPTASTLSRAREAWQPVRTLLRDAGSQARHQRWTEATNQFLAAMDHPGFSWKAAEVSLDDLPRHRRRGVNLRFRMAIAFVMANDFEAYHRIDLNAPNPKVIKGLQYQTFSLQFAEQGETNAERILMNVKLLINGDRKAGRKEWAAALGGYGDYDGGRYEEALGKFKAASECIRFSWACASLAMQAACVARLEDSAAARSLIQQAEVKWTRLQANYPEDWGNEWPFLALCRISMNEARRVLKTSERE